MQRSNLRSVFGPEWGLELIPALGRGNCSPVETEFGLFEREDRQVLFAIILEGTSPLLIGLLGAVYASNSGATRKSL